MKKPSPFASNRSPRRAAGIRSRYLARKLLKESRRKYPRIMRVL